MSLVDNESSSPGQYNTNSPKDDGNLTNNVQWASTALPLAIIIHP